MADLQRMALGTVQKDADSQIALWALMEMLAQSGSQVQHFFGSSTLSRWPAAAAITGVCSRHLDSWLMPADTCREVFVHGIGQSDLGLVQCTYDIANSATRSLGGSSLDTLSSWLDLPRLAVVDVSLLRTCVLPPRPPLLEGILLDRCADAGEFFYWQTWLEAAWGVPVLAGLTMLAPLRDGLLATPPGLAPSKPVLRVLGGEMARYVDWPRLMKLVARRPFLAPAKRLFRDESLRQPARGRPLTIAVAHDAALNCYFPDSIDLLELRGASIAVFSPLRDEALPPHTDLLYLGCGHPELHAADLADNQCMLSAVRRYIHGGGRVFADGGGMAYLAENVVTPAGATVPMVGALPLSVSYNHRRLPLEPAEIRMPCRTWLSEAGETLRGYRNPNWQVELNDSPWQEPPQSLSSRDMASRYQTIGSRIQFNLAAQPHLVARMLRFTESDMKSRARATATS